MSTSLAIHADLPEYGAFQPPDSMQLHGWKLEGHEDDVHLLPISGGADSVFLALLLIWLCPHINWRLVFTDTEAEDPEIHLSLDRLERYTGRKIERLKPKLGLFALVESWHGFLPSPGQRYCTPRLKGDSFREWMRQFDGKKKWIYVGIRADENDRVAFTFDECTTVFPMVELGIRREHVFRGLAQSIGIPKLYKYRSRSGCFSCPFQRRYELVGLLHEKPIEFTVGMRYEKVDKRDEDRHPVAPSLCDETGLTRNWLSLPEPKLHEIDGRVVRGSKHDLFGNAGVFIAVEYMYDGMYFATEFPISQRVISYSPTLHGIKGQIDRRAQHLLTTSEVFDMTPEEARAQTKWGIFYIEAPTREFDPEGPKHGGYTWAQGTSYAQIRHIIGWAERVLCGVTMKAQAERMERCAPTSLAYEWAESSAKALARVKRSLGSLVASAWYQPKDLDDTAEIDERFVTCPACSI